MIHKKALITVALIFFIVAVSYGIYRIKNYNVNREGKNHDQINLKVNHTKKEDINKNGNQLNTAKGRTFTGENLKYNTQSVPVLYYHSIGYEKGNELRIPKEKFREQIKYLKENGYTALTMDEFYEFLIYNKPIPDKSVLITFDDGYSDNYENAFPILKEFGLKATIFMITSSIDNEKNFLTSSQLKEMENYGIEVESHTVNHDKLDELSYSEQLTTLKNSKDSLEKLLDKKVDYIAYPYGRWNQDTLKASKAAGYKLAFTAAAGWANKDEGLYTLDRVYVSANHDIDEFQRRLTNDNYNSSN
ncbi:polysaccharide deacetylase family protein [Clostridium luticellarii]|jgi:peptidoglycan/xylan/chitin deacetylase (PgdA/CDA1 family)|uniref:polysaccharide deacetylase family protein n=1 Tax=Clostridium luticellarii TaxID=1691940 RepID=UPI0023578D1A|nr:polysaccharide deacetylase family protein [Clostridium luticellarii]MCI1944905.1 polysaccharide deacetylase family protein [Clostridium luticellarii]MCI1968419.1 polysaccharide deacetylase family protein [Clostridium luticellarii]MCI1995417.1 polysaccharide deacetylase family protein [Clostridium luticellarii]MCI2039480.1 polysaccharide deacetylase family protein [Clostridium luticellarii]